MSGRVLVLGYWINQYAGWHEIRKFADAASLVRFLKSESVRVESVDFVVEEEA